MRTILAAAAVLLLLPVGARGDEKPPPREHVVIRGIYGGMPEKRLPDLGANAVWID